MKYWIKTKHNFFGPFKSRRKAGKFLYGKVDTEIKYYLSLCPDKKIISATQEQVNVWEWCMKIENDLMQIAY